MWYFLGSIRVPRLSRFFGPALQRNPGEFSRILERALGISRNLAERITRDSSGEPIIVAAKAMGIKAAVLQRVLLFLNPVIGESAQRIYKLTILFDERQVEVSIGDAVDLVDGILKPVEFLKRLQG